MKETFINAYAVGPRVSLQYVHWQDLDPRQARELSREVAAMPGGSELAARILDAAARAEGSAANTPSG